MQLDPRFTDNHFTDKPELRLITTKDIDDENILDLLLNDYAKSILRLIKTGPKSTLQICTKLKISPSTVYRITYKMHNYGLIQRIYMMNDTGKKVSMYKIRLGAIQCQ
ncbi:MAG: helix-turn-helix domain-containing protein [Nitrosotalea sp.]